MKELKRDNVMLGFEQFRFITQIKVLRRYDIFMF